MMKTTISPRDLELLSAYLDGQLDRRSQMKIEARLNREPTLNEVLVDLERTRSLLRSAGPIKAPRSFKLKPEMVAQPKRRPVYPIFQFASAVAALLLIIVLLGDFAGPRPATLVTSSSPQESQLAAGSQERAAEYSAQKQAATGLPPEAAAGIMAAPETATPTTLGEAADQAPTMEAFLSAAPMTDTQAFSSSQIMSNTVALATGEPAGQFVEPLPQAAEVSAEPAANPLNWFRIAEISLASLAVILAVVSIWLRRKA
jgi:hypothetical protein